MKKNRLDHIEVDRSSIRIYILKSNISKIQEYVCNPDFDIFAPINLHDSDSDSDDSDAQYITASHKCPYTLLSWACEHGHHTIVEMIFGCDNRNAMFHTNNNLFNNDLFERACKGGHTLIAKMLINNIGIRNMIYTPSFRNEYCDKFIPKLASTPLSIACRYGMTEIVDILLQRSDRGDRYVMYHCNCQAPFIDACAGGHANIVKKLLTRWERGDSRINPFANNCAAFQKACENGHLSVAKMFINSVRDGSAFYKGYVPCNEFGREFTWSMCMSALPGVCLNGHFHIIEFIFTEVSTFVDSICAYDDMKHKGIVPVMSFFNACAGGHLDIANFLLETKRMTFNGFDNKCAAFEYACKYGRLNIVKFLVDCNNICGNCFFDPSDNGNQPFVDACGGGHEDIVRYLLNIRAQQLYGNIRANSMNNLAFRMACANGHENIARMLLSLNDTYPNDRYLRIEPADADNNAFVRACGNGHENIVDMLLGLQYKYPQINPGSCQNLALFLACGGGHVNIVKKLIRLMDEGDRRIVLCDGQNRAFVASCMSRKNAGVFDVFVERIRRGDRSINQIGSNSMAIIEALSLPLKGGRPSRMFRELWGMVMNGVIEISLLVENTRLFQLACERNMNQVAQVMLTMLDKYDHFNHDNVLNNALRIACENNNCEMVTVLLKRMIELGIRPNRLDNRSNALYCACMRGHVDIVKLLLDCKVKGDFFWAECNNALDIACTNGHTDIVRALFNMSDKGDARINVDECFYGIVKTSCRQGCYNIMTCLVQKFGTVRSFSQKLVCTAFKQCVQNGHCDIFRLLQQHVDDKNFGIPGIGITCKINNIVENALKTHDLEMIHLLLSSIHEERVPFKYYCGGIDVYKKVHIYTRNVPFVIHYPIIRNKIKSGYNNAKKSPRTEWIWGLRKTWINGRFKGVLYTLGRLHTWRITVNARSLMT